MDAEQLELARRGLLTLRDQLTALVSATTDDVKPVDLGEPIGRLSRVDAMQQQQMSAENRRSAQRRRRQVESALARIEADEYGECQGCGEEIEPRRLSAKPEAPLCLTCQSELETRL